MWPTAWRFLAAVSLIAAAGAATRPHYGGTLRVETRARAVSPDLAFDPLVTFNDSAEPQPALAVAWRHDTDFKRWEFQLRPGVKFHDGSPFTVALAAEALERLSAVAEANALVIRSERPAPRLLSELAGIPIWKRGAGQTVIG